MQKFLVGGAVRDKLLSLPVQERDWVVVGSTPEELLKLGYRQVGKDFPVFLHPDTNEEYALARTERKAGRGHQGFDVFSSPDVTLEQDLERRDLTINAIAQDENGRLTDPYGGLEDINKRVLRHVSPAFTEDPLRVLRVARFAAKFWSLGFTIAPETLSLMSSICASGELEQLSKERVWSETKRALESEHPEIFILVLMQIGALQRISPELNTALQKKSSLLNLSQLKYLKDFESRYICLVLLASQTESDFSADTASNVNDSFACTNDLQEMAILSVKFFSQCCNATSLNSVEIYTILHALDIFRRESRSQRVLKYMKRMQPIFHIGNIHSLSFLENLAPKLNAISLDKEKINTLDGKAIGESIKALRIEAIDTELLQLNKSK